MPASVIRRFAYVPDQRQLGVEFVAGRRCVYEEVADEVAGNLATRARNPSLIIGRDNRAMFPVRYSSIFKNRWWAMLWAAGILLFAYQIADSQPTDNAAADTDQAALLTNAF
ncbi:MAG: hypothetical protein ABIO80_07405 [Sphingomicrobium sp.]